VLRLRKFQFISGRKITALILMTSNIKITHKAAQIFEQINQKTTFNHPALKIGLEEKYLKYSGSFIICKCSNDPISEHLCSSNDLTLSKTHT
jgi:hypothetical protein